MYEYACHEGNYALGNILRGARLKEANDAKKTASSEVMSDADEISVVGGGSVLIATAPMLAHHAFGGEFDPNRPVLLKGPVDQGRMGEPARVDSPSKVDQAGRHQGRVDGRRRHAEHAAPPRHHARVAEVGTELVIDGYQARDHSLLRANGRNVTYPDGRKLFLGSSGTGAPTDGADPTEAPKPAGRGRGGR